MIKEELKNNDNLSEEIGSTTLWKLRNKLCNKYRDPPTAMMDSKGKLLTDETLILEAAQTEHTNRLLPNECKEEIKCKNNLQKFIPNEGITAQASM